MDRLQHYYLLLTSVVWQGGRCGLHIRPLPLPAAAEHHPGQQGHGGAAQGELWPGAAGTDRGGGGAGGQDRQGTPG